MSYLYILLILEKWVVVTFWFTAVSILNWDYISHLVPLNRKKESSHIRIYNTYPYATIQTPRRHPGQCIPKSKMLLQSCLLLWHLTLRDNESRNNFHYIQKIKKASSVLLCNNSPSVIDQFKEYSIYCLDYKSAPSFGFVIFFVPETKK